MNSIHSATGVRSWLLMLSLPLLLSAGLVSGALWASSLGVFDANADVGRNPKAGSTTYDPGVKSYRVTGGGANIWLKEDAFQFVYKRMSGDMKLSAEVAFEGKGVEMHRKAALMIRQSLDADSAYADIAVHGDGLTSLQYRPGAGVDTSEFRLPMKAARRVTIERRGNEITVEASDGVTKPVVNGPVIVTMSDPVYVGLAVCSHNEQVLETAIFSNVSLTGSRAAALSQLIPEHGGEGLPLR